MLPELNDRQRSQTMAVYRSGTPLHRAMPLELPNGRKVPAVDVGCRQCRQLIAPEQVRGHITRPLPTVIQIDAGGYCQHCQRMTRVLMRVRAVGDTMQVEVPVEGGWGVARPKPLSMWQRLLRWLRSVTVTSR